jgi:hypothetical protein
VSMNKDVLRPDETGPYTHVVDRWIHESQTILWDAVVSDPDDATIVHHITRVIQIPTLADKVIYNFTDDEMDFIAEIIIAVVSVAGDGSVKVSYYDDEADYARDWDPISGGRIASTVPQRLHVRRYAKYILLFVMVAAIIIWLWRLA